MTKQSAVKRRTRKLSETAVLDALRKSSGNISEAGVRLGVGRSSIFHYVETRPEIRQLVDDFRERLVDDAESALLQAVESGQPWAVRFALLRSRQGRQRGFGDAHEIHVAGGVEVSHEVSEESAEAVSRMARYLESQGIPVDDYAVPKQAGKSL